MKRTLLLMVLLLTAITVLPRDIDIKVPYPGTQDPPRSVVTQIVTASIDGLGLTVNFSEPTASYIYVEDQNGILICSETTTIPANQVTFNLPSTIAGGTYTLYIQAYGCTWYGEFDYAAE